MKDKTEKENTPQLETRKKNMESTLLYLVILLSTGISAKIADIDKPIPIEDITVVSGHAARLDCDLQSSRKEDSAYLVLWYIESQKQPIYSVDLRARPLEQAKHWVDDRLAHRAQFTTFDTAALLIDNVTEEDNGIYRCRVDFRHSPTRHLRYKLDVVQAPKMPEIYGANAGKFGSIAGPYDEGSDQTLICQVTGGGPKVRVAWYRDGNLIDSHHDYVIEGVLLNHLHLYNLSRSDHGATYVCRAELLAIPSIPPTSRNVTIHVRLKPSSVEIILPSPFLEAGKAQQIQCKATGANPPALVSWWAGYKQLLDSENIVSKEGNVTISTLTVLPSMEDDGRSLICRAETPELTGSSSEESWRMQVYYPPRTNLVLGQRFIPEEIREGSDIYLECNIRSNPPHHRLIWLHNGRMLSDSRNGDVVMVNQSLVLRQVGRHSAGNYTCIAANRQGETASHLHLLVKYAPTCRRSKPRIIAVSREQTARLRCEVDADPSVVTFRWTLSTGRETALVAREAPVNLDLSSTLEYTPRRDADFGQLQCWAMNDVGKQKDPCVFNIVKEGLPSAPSDCALHSLSDGVVEVKCRTESADASDAPYEDDGAAGGSGVIITSSSHQFWLQLYDADTKLLLRNVSQNVAQFRVSGIDPATRVLAIVTATNRQGRSESVTVEGAVERAVGSRAANEPDSSVATIVLLAAPGALLIAIIALAAILAIYQRQRKKTLRQRQQQQQQQQQQQSQTTDDDASEYINASRRPDLIKAKHESCISDHQVPIQQTDSTEQNNSLKLFDNGPTVTYSSIKQRIDDSITFPTVPKQPIRVQANVNIMERHELHDQVKMNTYVYR